MVGLSSFGGFCSPSCESLPPSSRESRVGTAGAATTRRLRVAPVSPPTRRCNTAGGAGGPSRAFKGFVAMPPSLPMSAGAGAKGSRWCAAPSAPASLAFCALEELQQPPPACGMWGSGRREKADYGLQLAGGEPRVRDYAPRHAQLLSLEREQHRVATDRLHQRARGLWLKWKQEREAHVSTTLLLFKTQIDFCIMQEESARHALVAAEAEDSLNCMQRGRCGVAEKRRYKAVDAATRTAVFPADPHAKPRFLYAHDSDLLRALQRSEAYIVQLERHFEELGQYRIDPASFEPPCTHNSTCSEAAIGGTARDGTTSYAPLSPYIHTLT
ncbi:ubiquitin hydrolase [Trypanosoma rangeli]|uniref:Ubiquitin hydrolase n=1 Tax=Trypanosoma rangeli TaxID=5698 RepID=A0A3R7MJH2_TRYRA|nr:ubiquitin hydrolase [Trypanosoma rangeli]RNF03610.1 ubiquitin hydrolase [Trypanosoma rangeli]|eukprot:RNF03610.1 ubiquitin hydrolase [Trypanosoma rangeli]